MLGTTAAVLVVGGALVVGTAPPQTFGWFAHAPLADEVHTGSPGSLLPLVRPPWCWHRWVARRHPGAVSIPTALVALFTAALVSGVLAGLRRGRPSEDAVRDDTLRAGQRGPTSSQAAGARAVGNSAWMGLGGGRG